jgi:hypothetical protein
MVLPAQEVLSNLGLWCNLAIGPSRMLLGIVIIKPNRQRSFSLAVNTVELTCEIPKVQVLVLFDLL